VGGWLPDNGALGPVATCSPTRIATHHQLIYMRPLAFDQRLQAGGHHHRIRLQSLARPMKWAVDI
jgi:hypothetical protein